MNNKGLLAAILALCVTTSSCNVLSTVDNPDETSSVVSAARARANAGDCAGARDLLRNIKASSDNEVKLALGWAYLCLAGATAARITASIYKYSSAGADLTVVGLLGRELLPMTNDRIENIHLAAATFNGITDDRKSIQMGIAHFVRAASVLAEQATNQATTDALSQDDIAPSSCAAVAADCSAATVVNCSAGMSAAKVVEFNTQITNAMNYMTLAGVTSLTDLARRIQAGLALGSADDNIGRCFIRANVVSQ